MRYSPERKIYIGEIEKESISTRFGIQEKDRTQHIYIIGQTGTGKSKLMEAIAIQDLQNGEGFIFLDPLGQSVERIIEYVDEDCLNRVIYFMPSKQDCSIGLNIFDDVDYDQRHFLVNSLLAAFKKIYGTGAWSDRLEYMLSNTLLALTEYPNATLLDVERMYTDDSFREKVTKNIKDSQVRDYWVNEYTRYSKRYVQEATPAIKNKIGLFTSNPLIRSIVGQAKPTLNFREIIDKGNVLLVNFATSLIGTKNAEILGALITTKIYLAGLSRENQPSQKSTNVKHCNLYMDEFQMFVNPSFATVLPEIGKHGVNLILSHQYIGQIYDENEQDGYAVRNAVFKNINTLISFRVNLSDADFISKQFYPDVTADDLTSVPRMHMYLTLNTDGIRSAPFLARTIVVPDPPPPSLRERVIEQSLQTYGIKKEGRNTPTSASASKPS